MPKVNKKCVKCGELKVLDYFPRCDSCSDGRRNVCKSCRTSQKMKNYYKNHSRNIELNRKYRAQDPKKMRRYRRKIKLEVMTHYCHGELPFCKICGFDDIRALCIDHVNGHGAEHRRALTSNDLNKLPRDGGGFNTYLWLRRNDYPKGFQVLCFNCNQIKECEQRDSRIIQSAQSK